MDADRLKHAVNSAEAMRLLLGRRVRYQGELFEITDLLHDEGMLVLSAEDGSDVQDDSFGRPNRLVPRRRMVRFRDADGCPTGLWDELAFLDGPLERESRE